MPTSAINGSSTRGWKRRQVAPVIIAYLRLPSGEYSDETTRMQWIELES